MFVTAVKTAVVEALVSGFGQLATSPINNGLDLVPNSVTIEYPLQEVEWPAVYVQFRSSTVQWQGLQPDQYVTYASGITISGHNYPAYTSSRVGYFEGNIDLQIIAMHSEERDRLYDSVTNLILMGQGSAASNAFYSSIQANDLVGLTLLPTSYTPTGDVVVPGTPFSPEEFTYQASMRIRCVGDFYENKYNYQVPEIQYLVASGTVAPEILTYPTL